MIKSKLRYYYSNESKINILFKIFNFELINNETKNGLFLIEDHLGKIFETPLDTLDDVDLDKKTVLNVLIYKNVETEELSKIDELVRLQKPIVLFILVHKLYNFNDLLDNTKISSQDIKIIIPSSNLENNFFYTENEIKSLVKDLDNYKLLYLKNDQKYSSKKEINSSHFIPFAAFSLLRLILSPVIELKKMINYLGVSNYRLIIHLIELFKFTKHILFFIISNILIPTYQKTILAAYHKIILAAYYKIILAAYYKIILVFYYVLKHNFLITKFKSYGLFVDTYYLIDRYFKKIKSILKVLVIRIFFQILSVLNLIFSITPIRIFYFFERNINYFISTIIPYTKYLVLMLIFKSFGLVVDFYYVFKYFLTRILPYPVYKIYWFSEFQYKKRIKNKIWME